MTDKGIRTNGKLTGPMRKHHDYERMLYGTTNGKWRGVQACLLCCLLFFAPLKNVAQNLVPNPSFELRDTCPYTIGFQEGDRPQYWYSWLNSPEYFHACAGSLLDVDTLVSVPQNGWTFQHAFDGEAYVGLMTFGNSLVYREHVGVELLSPLVEGELYCLSFRVNLAMDGTNWPAKWACNNMGMLFTMNPNAWEGLIGPPFPFRNYAHLYSPSIITDTAGWTLVSGAFVADSAYRFVALGNFFEDGLTDTLSIQPGISAGAFYLIDAVCVSPGKWGCEMTGIVDDWLSTPPQLWPNPASTMLSVQWAIHSSFRVELFDAIGRKVGDQLTKGGSMQLNVGGLEPGWYTARLSQGGNIAVEQFIVEH